MKGLLLIDTSIMLEILGVPGKSSSDSDIPRQFDAMLSSNEYTLYLPIATVLETGNHISQIKAKNGDVRRLIAQQFIKKVKMALDGTKPFKALAWEAAEMGPWLDRYPDFAQSRKSFGDLSIISQYEKLCNESPQDLPKKIWTKDGHLDSYRRNWMDD
jgi:hypothetical protein